MPNPQSPRFDSLWQDRVYTLLRSPELGRNNYTVIPDCH